MTSFIKIPNETILQSQECKEGLSVFVTLAMQKPFCNTLKTTLEVIKAEQTNYKDLRSSKSLEYYQGLIFNLLSSTRNSKVKYAFVKCPELEEMLQKPNLFVDYKDLKSKIETLSNQIVRPNTESKAIISLEYLENPSNYANSYTVLNFDEYEDLIKAYQSFSSNNTKFYFPTFFQIYFFAKSSIAKANDIKGIVEDIGNQLTLKEFIENSESISLTSIQKFTKLNKPTLANYINSLVISGFFIETKSSNSNNSKTYTINPKYLNQEFQADSTNPNLITQIYPF